MDGHEFDEFFTASYRRVTGQVYAIIGDYDEAQECVQEAFARAWSHRRKLADMAHPEAYVRTTAYHLAVSRWRRVVRARRPGDRALSVPVESTAHDESHVALVSALRHLPEVQRRAIMLHHIADLPVRDVARETGVPEGTVKARLSRGRATLALLLTEPVSDSVVDPTVVGATVLDVALQKGAHHA
jgi:RNA polymerase sigma-70 factor (ECF subfamily)